MVCQYTSIIGNMKIKPDELNVKIGLKIKLERTKLKLSQEKLAELADLTQNSICAIERGTSVASINSLNRIATALNMELTELLDTSKVNIDSRF